MLRQTLGVISLEVRDDDGSGFVTGEPGSPAHREGLGLLGMRERAARLGGTLKVDSSPGRGTRIVLEIPHLAGLGKRGRRTRCPLAFFLWMNHTLLRQGLRRILESHADIAIVAEGRLGSRSRRNGLPGISRM